MSRRQVEVSDRFPLVCIRWVDSAEVQGWTQLDSLTRSTAKDLECISVGFLIDETALAVTLAPHVGDLHIESRTQGTGIMIIPVCSITERLSLTAHSYA